MMRKLCAFCAILFLSNAADFSQAQDGKLRIQHINVGQGNGAALISPQGEVVLFDKGEYLKKRACQGALHYFHQLEIQHIEYVFEDNLTKTAKLCRCSWGFQW